MRSLTIARAIASPSSARRALVYLLSGLLALLAGGCLGTGPGGTLTPPTKRIEGAVQLPSGAPWAGASLSVIAFSGDQTLSQSAVTDVQGRFSLTASAAGALLIVATGADPAGGTLRLSGIVFSGGEQGVTIDAITSACAESWAPFAGKGLSPDPQAVQRAAEAVRALFVREPQLADFQVPGPLLAGDFGSGLTAGSVEQAIAPYLPPAPDTALGQARALIADSVAADLDFDALEALLAAHDRVAQGGRSLFAQYAARIGRLHDDVLSGRLDTIVPGEYLERSDGYLVPWRRTADGVTRIHRTDGTLWILEPQTGDSLIVRRALDPDPFPSDPAVVDATLAQSAELTLSPPSGSRTSDRLHEAGTLADEGLDAPLYFDLDIAGSGFGPFAPAVLTGSGSLAQGDVQAAGSWTLDLLAHALDAPTSAQLTELEFTGTIRAGEWTYTGTLAGHAAPAQVEVRLDGSLSAPTLGQTLTGTTDVVLSPNPGALHFIGRIEAIGEPTVQIELQRSAAGSVTMSATRLGRTLDAAFTPNAASGDQLHIVAGGAVLDLVRTTSGVEGHIYVGGVLAASVHDKTVDYADGSSETLP